MTTYEMGEAEAPIDYEHFLNTYGLGPEELDRTVPDIGYGEGTVADMLVKCRHVGITVAKAYAEQGIAGTEATFVKLQDFAEGFNGEIGERTRNYHEGKIDRESLLAGQPGESPDFLV